MSIIITTIGQRDLQIVKNKKCIPFDNFDLMDIQNKIQEIGYNKLNWLPYIKGNNRLEQVQDKKEFIKFKHMDWQNTITVTFPLIEKILKKVKKDMKKKYWEQISDLYVFYTDRRDQYDERENNKDYIKKEPWLFSKIFNHFFVKIKTHYDIDIISLNLVKIEDNNGNINRNDIIEFIDNFIKKNLYEKNKIKNANDKVIVACSAGIPDVKNVIEEVSALYFSENNIFYDQDQINDNIVNSKYHEYKKKTKIMFELRERVLASDFDAAWNIINKYKYIINDYLPTEEISTLLELSHHWLSADPKIATRIINNLLKSDLSYKNLLIKMNDIIVNFKNISSRSLIRFYYLYDKKNYWGAATVFITTIENLLIQFINSVFKKSYDKNNNCFHREKFPDKFKPSEKLLKKSNKKCLINGWEFYSDIIHFIADNEKDGNIKEMAKYLYTRFLKKDFDFYKFKNKSRNQFIHKGEGVNQKEIDKLLFPRPISKQFITNYEEKTEVIKQIIDIMNNLGILYYNWLPEMRKIILEKL